MKITKKHALLISGLAILMALCTIAGATLAYLFVKTGEIKNTFAPSNIGLTLTETTTNYKMIPGETIAKDPKVTVKNDVDCYVFVKVEESANFGTYMTYEIAEGWNELTGVAGVAGVYYREVAAGTYATATEYPVIKGNTVTVPDTVTKDLMNSLYNPDGTVKTDAQPTLTFTAYAIQKDGFDDAAAAWPYALAQSNTP